MLENEIKHYIDSLHYDLELTAKYSKVFASQIFKKLYPDISAECFSALDTISCHEGICQRDLAKLILKDRANTGRILNHLEEKGLITRFNDTKNKKLVRKMEITLKGKNLLLEAVTKFRPISDKICESVTKEEEMMVRSILKKLRDCMDNLIEKQI